MTKVIRIPKPHLSDKAEAISMIGLIIAENVVIYYLLLSHLTADFEASLSGIILWSAINLLLLNYVFGLVGLGWKNGE